MGYTKYTKNLLEPLVKNSFSIYAVMRKLGLKQAGGTHSYISKKVRDFSIDTSHFLGSRWKKGLKHKGGTFNTKTPEEILIKRVEGTRGKRPQLVRALLESGVEYKCAKCGIKEWSGTELSLPIHHKDGNWLDDEKENLEFLCPNCHSQTKNFGKKKLS